MLENKEAIDIIKGQKRVSLYCPIGKDYYTADIYIKFVPDKYYMDYMKLDKFIEKMSGAKLTIEQAVEKIYKHLCEYYPERLSVTIDATSNTHLRVQVTKGTV